MSDKIRIAGAQIPINDYSIQYNVNEIKKALDWAADNDVDIIQTPESSLSGYDPYHWMYRETEQSKDDIILDAALKEVEEYQRKVGVGLNLGTCLLSREEAGYLARNQIRYYTKQGQLYNTTDKMFIVGFDEPCVSCFEPAKVFKLPLDVEWPWEIRCVGMICNDMWSYSRKQGKDRMLVKSLMENTTEDIPDLIFHSTNGYKFPEEVVEKAGKHLASIRDNVYDTWHEAWLKFTAFSGISHILTVDTCVEWKWDGNENTVDRYKTSSRSGVVDPLGEWVVEAPRYGRQYFYYDYDLNSKEKYHDLIYHEDNGTFSKVMIPPVTSKLRVPNSNYAINKL
tara:strand:+ start:58 stop:1074 length:1017 start_codon:yes stop_codon:yes gene_type:complete